MPIDRSNNDERPRLSFMQDLESSSTIAVKPKSSLIIAIISGTPAQIVQQWQSLANSERNPS